MTIKKKGLMVLGAGCLLIAFTWLLNQPSRYLDLTSHHNYEVAPSTAQLLQSLPGPLNITVVGAHLEEESRLNFIIDGWKKIKPDIHLTFQTTPLTPDEVQKHSFTDHGIILTCNQSLQSFNLNSKALSSHLMNKLLFQVKQQTTYWIAFLTGHGEPDLLGSRPQDYGLMSSRLQNEGLKTQSLNLAQVGQIPDNTSLLVITNPKSEFLPKEIEQIENYIKQGGNILWLMDFQGQPLTFLSDAFGVYPHSGIIVDKHGHEMGTPHPAIAVVTQYSKPFSQYHDHLTAFPWAQALIIKPKTDETPLIFLKTHAHSWTQIGSLEGELRFEPEKGEKAGPLALGTLIERKIEGKESTQRIIVIGNHRFATNAVIQNYGNEDFTKSLIYHLLHEDDIAQFESPRPKDTLTFIPKSFEKSYQLILQVLFPLSFVLIGMWINFQRQRKLKD